MKLKSMAAAAAACALALGVAGCSEEDSRERGNIPIAPAPPTADTTDPAPVTDEPTDPVDEPTAPPTDVPTQDAGEATLTIGGESIETSFVSCWSFDETYSVSVSGMDANGNDRGIEMSTEGEFVHYIAVTEWFSMLGEWGDQYLENNPTVSVANDVWSIDATVRMLDGTITEVQATVPCEVDGEMYEGSKDKTLVAPDLVVSQDYDLSPLVTLTASQFTIDGVAVPTMGVPQCDVFDDGYKNVSVNGITADGGTFEISLNWPGTGRAPTIDVDIDHPNGDWFWYWWAEGYSTENPPPIAVNGNVYAIGGTFEDGSFSHEIAGAIVCP